MFRDATITTAGADLITQWFNGEKMTIERATAGQGTVEAEQLAAQTALSDEKAEVSIVNRVVSDEGLKLHLQFKPGEEAFVANQIGIWAKVGDEGASTLLALYQDETGIEIPAQADALDFNYAFYAIIAVDTDERIELTIDRSAYLTVESLNEVQETVQGLIDSATEAADKSIADAKDELQKKLTEAEGKIDQMLGEADLNNYALKTDLDGKADAEHMHDAADITDGNDTWAAKSHGHEISEVTRLETRLGDIESGLAAAAVPQSPITVAVPTEGWVQAEPVMLTGSVAGAQGDNPPLSPLPGGTGNGEPQTYPPSQGGQGGLTPDAVDIATIADIPKPFSLTVTATGVNPESKLAYFANLLQQGNEAIDEPARGAWGSLIRGAVTAADKITLWASEAPKSAFSMSLVPIAVKEPVTEILGILGGGGTAVGKSIDRAVVTLSAEELVYTGQPQEPTVTKVMLGDVELTPNEDYYALSSKQTDVGEYNIVIAGIINYSGSIVKPWQITRADPQLTLSATTATITGVMGTVNSEITITHAGDGAITFEVTDGEDGSSVTAELSGSNVKLTSKKAGTCTVKVKLAQGTNHIAAEKDITVTVKKATGSITCAPTEITISGELGTTADVTLTVTGDGAISVSGAEAYATGVVSERKKVTFTSVKVTEAPQTATIKLADSESYTGSSCTVAITVQTYRTTGVFGVEWDKLALTTLTRTDDAAEFGDPVPALSNGTGSSPFDDIYPWHGIVKETIDGNAMVKIPKFYFKWTDANGKLKLQISPQQAEGFDVSPAHMDRGDGKGERDFVYVGRYHCAANDYKSVTGKQPQVSMTRAAARTAVTKLTAAGGGKYYLMDYAMAWTIRMLYLVEFANWDTQATIGFGCGNNSAAETMGKTDAMQYHTGTASAKRDTYAVGVQYRWMEDLWANVWDFCDGITFSSSKAYVFKNPTQYADTTTNGTLVGTIPTTYGVIKDWTVPTTAGLKWALVPKTVGGDSTSDYSTYVADRVYVDSSDGVLYVGGHWYYQDRDYGLFCSFGDTAGGADSYLGARLLYLP